MRDEQKQGSDRKDQVGKPGGGSGSTTSIGRAGPKKQKGDASQGNPDPGAKGSQAEREAQRKGQDAPGGGKRRSDKKT